MDLVASRRRGPRRVLVIENHTLMSAGVLSLLQREASGREASLDVRGALYSNEARLVEAIDAFRPHVLLFDTSVHVAVVAALLRLRMDQAVLLAVEVNAEGTIALKYERRPVEIASAAELVALISST